MKEQILLPSFFHCDFKVAVTAVLSAHKRGYVALAARRKNMEKHKSVILILSFCKLPGLISKSTIHKNMVRH